MNELNKKKKKESEDEENKLYVLQENLESFSINKIFIGTFLLGLWNYPEAMFKIINNTSPHDIKTTLAPLIVDNFYNNYLSGNYIENNLLYIFSLLLKDEIDKLTDIEEVETFLDNTKCGYLLEQLQKKTDIQLFFKKVILKTIEKFENLCSFREINFSIQQKNNELTTYEKGDKKSGKKNDFPNEEIFKRIVINKLDPSINFSKEENPMCTKNEKIENENFVKKYVPNISSKELKNRAEKAKNEGKNDLYEYYNRFEKEINKKNQENLYSNETLMADILKTSSPPNILTLYQWDFMIMLSIIEQLIDDLIQNIILLPYSIKCICKIISVLIRNKFKNISKAEENGFVSKFILGRLLIPIISQPSFNALISDFVISGNTLKNIQTTNIILMKLFSGNLFYNNKKDEEYTPFNWVFLDKMDKILYFFENSKKVNLPNFIEKLITNKLPKDYKYDFFDENKEEIYANISICFNVKNLSLLIDGVKKSPEIFNKLKKGDKLKKAFDKLDDKDTFNEIKTAEEKIINNYQKEQSKLKSKEKSKEKDNPIEFYFLYNDKSIEKKYQNLFEIDNKIDNFYIDLKKIEKEKGKKLEEDEKNIIKVKNYLSSSIGNYRLLNISDFSKDSISDTIKMLTQIKSYMTLPNFILNNDTIPSTWYINSLLDYLEKIPDEYKKNDFQKLFSELYDNLNESIDSLDFQRLIMFRNKLKFLDKINNYYENTQKLITEISINEKIKEIVEQNFVPVEMTFRYNDEDEKDNRFEIKSSNVKLKIFEDNMIFEDPKKKVIIFKTIEAFSTYFPNLAKYQSLQDKNPIDIITELKIPEKINHYFEIIKEKVVKKDNNIKEDEFDNLYQEKIKDYIMNKIYEKIYPPEPHQKDSKIFKISIMLSWVEPQLIVDKEYIYDNILPDILNQFNQINIVKTPYKKQKCIREIFNLIHSLIRFNDENKTMIGSDDVTPVLNYAFIKAHPFRIYTDLEFVKAFLDEKEGIGAYDINQLESAYTLLLSYTHESFKLNKEEYTRRCIEAANDNAAQMNGNK